MFLAYLFCALALAEQPNESGSVDDEITPETTDNIPSTNTVEEQPSLLPPTPSYIPPPVYPEQALSEGIGGSVLLAITVSAEGTVVGVEVLDSDRDDLAEAALINARSFVFTPATLADGTPVDARIEYRTVFTVEKAAAISVEGQVREAGPRVPLKQASVVAVSYSRGHGSRYTRIVVIQ